MKGDKSLPTFEWGIDRALVYKFHVINQPVFFNQNFIKVSRRYNGAT